MRIRNVRRNRGDLLLWQIVGIALVAVIVGALAYNAWQGLRTQQSTADYNVRREALNRLVDRFDNESRSVDAYFIPSHDVTGAPNPVPAAGSAAAPGATAGYVPGVAIANPQTHEFDSYSKDVNGSPHFLAFLYDSTAQTLSVYPYSYRDATGLAVGVASKPSAVYSGITYFSASDLLNSQVHLVDAYVQANYTAKGGTATDHLVNLGFPEVVGGDKGLQLFIATSTTNSKLATGLTLTGRAAPRQEDVAVIEAPLHAALQSSSLNLTFVNPMYPSQQVQTTSANYRGAFVLNQAGCSATTLPVTPVGTNAGPSATWLVSPRAPGECSFVVMTSDSTQMVIINVTVGNYSPLIVTPAKLVYTNPESTSPQAFDGNGNLLGSDNGGAITATEQNDLAPIATSSTCSGIASPTTTSSTDGSLALTTAANGVGTCTISYTDGHGGVGATSVIVNQFSPLTVSPPSYSGLPNSTASINAAEANYANALYYNLNDCAGYITVNGSSATGWQPFGNGPAQSFTLTTVTPTTAPCSLLVDDDHNNSGGSPAGAEAVAVTVQSNAVYTLQVTAPNPTTVQISGSGTSFSASAPLTSGDGASSLAVGVTGVSGPCSVAPSGWQTSGSSFAVSPVGSTAGTCAITVAADGTAGDSPQTVNVIVQAAPAAPTPPPAPVPVQIYSAFWSAQVCADAECNTPAYGVEFSDGYMLMSDGSVIGTLGGPLPYQQDCSLASAVYNKPAPYDPGVWSASFNGSTVAQTGVTDMWQNSFNQESVPGSTPVNILSWPSSYDYFADVNSNVGSVPSGFTGGVESVDPNADFYALWNCNP